MSAYASTARSGCQSRSFDGRSVSHQPNTRAKPATVNPILRHRPLTKIQTATTPAAYTIANGNCNHGIRTSKYNAAIAHSVHNERTQPSTAKQAKRIARLVQLRRVCCASSGVDIALTVFFCSALWRKREKD